MSRRLPQLKLGPRIGGVKELATRATFYNGIANTLMVAGFYYQSDPAVPGTGLSIQEVLPAVEAFYLALVAGGLAVMMFEHVVMVKAQAEYNQLQAFDEDVSPIRRDVGEIADRLDDIEERLAEIQKDGDEPEE